MTTHRTSYVGVSTFPYSVLCGQPCDYGDGLLHASFADVTFCDCIHFLWYNQSVSTFDPGTANNAVLTGSVSNIPLAGSVGFKTGDCSGISLSVQNVHPGATSCEGDGWPDSNASFHVEIHYLGKCIPSESTWSITAYFNIQTIGGSTTYFSAEGTGPIPRGTPIDNQLTDCLQYPDICATGGTVTLTP